MLPSKLQEIKKNIERKSSSSRTDGESELLNELKVLEEFLEDRNGLVELSEEVRSKAQITSGPGGPCACCGKY